MNSLYQNESYDNPLARSPNSLSQQQQSLTLPRSTSRSQYDSFSQQQQQQQPQQQQPQNGLYGMDEMPQRFDGARGFNDRMSSGFQGAAGGYGGSFDMQQPMPAWNNSSYGQNNHLASLGVTTRGRPGANRGARGSIPPMWHDQSQNMQGPGPLGGYGSPAAYGSMRSDQFSQDGGEDDLIPTAIVIKNIPFAVKKEQLVDVMTQLNLPIPYAFNYHFDNGVFRGLAFANFTTPEETAQVINGMNHLDLQGRKLRVEYKKMLPQAERDRIEREKRERRGQLEEQHRPIAPAQLQNQHSMSSLSSQVQAHSPSPISARAMQPNLDMNDPTTLTYYSKLILFQSDPAQGDMVSFPADIPANHRKIIHGLAHNLGLSHASHGSGEQRQVHVYRNPASMNSVSPTMGSGAYGLDPNRRQLNRAATTDFTNVRSTDPNFYNGVAPHNSSFMNYQDAQGGLSVAPNLRSAKSVADLRSYTPSPAQSASSFPAGLTGNLSRFQEYGPPSPGSTRSTFTPTTGTMPPNPDSLLNGMSGMNLGSSGLGPSSGSPHRLRGMMSWDRETPSTGPGPIGGHRTFSQANDDQNRNRSGGSLRRGPLAERNNTFPQQQGRQQGHQQRGSDEINSANSVEINGP